MDIGAHLREAREARGLSIATLATATRIKGRLLEAIERNDIGGLPPRPYARGFVSTYARELGLDPHETVASYFAQFRPAPGEGTRASRAAPGAVPGFRFSPTAFAVLAVAAVVAVTAALFAARTPGQAAARGPAPIGTMGRTPAASIPAAADTVPASGSPAAGRPPIQHAAATSALVVTLEATGPAWVTADADGRRALFQTMQPGTTHTLRANRAVALRVGDAGVVRLSVNGGTPRVMGARGEVLSVRLTAEGSTR